MTEEWKPPKKGDYAYGTNECGLLAWWRYCHQPGENKGSYSPGRGYTSYHKKPIPVCATRCFHGCPTECVVPHQRADGTVERWCQKPDPDWRAAAEAIRGLRGVQRQQYQDTLIDGLIQAVEKWRKIAEEKK